MYCVAKNLCSTAILLLNILTLNVIQFFAWQRAFAVFFEGSTTSKINLTSDDLFVLTTQCYAKKIVWAGVAIRDTEEYSATFSTA